MKMIPYEGLSLIHSNTQDTQYQLSDSDLYYSMGCMRVMRITRLLAGDKYMRCFFRLSRHIRNMVYHHLHIYHESHCRVSHGIASIKAKLLRLNVPINNDA